MIGRVHVRRAYSRGRRLARRVLRSLTGVPDRPRRPTPAPVPAKAPRPKPKPKPAPRPARPPVLSVVVAVSAADRHLDECLASLERQTLRRIEVLLAGPAELLDTLTGDDPRVRRVPYEGASRAGARNAGAAAATGTFLTFLAADDTVPADGYALLTKTLQRSGSDFAVGSVRRLQNGRGGRPAWALAVHVRDRLGVTLEEFPEVAQDVLLGNRVFRRGFWAEQVGPLEETGESSELVATVTGYVRAATFDVLQAVTYHAHLRTDSTTLVRERYDVAYLDDRVPALRRAWAVVAGEAPPAVAGAWLGGVVDDEFGAWTTAAGSQTEAYRERLQAAARTWWAQAGEHTWPHVRFDRRLRLWLAAQGCWPQLERLVEWVRLYGPVPATRVEGERVLAELPLLDELGEDVPEPCRELAPGQTALAACLERAWFDADGRLVLEGWAFPRGVDLGAEVPRTEAVLVDLATGQEVPVPVEPRVDPAATRWANSLHADVDTAAFRLAVDVDALPGPGEGEGTRRWQLRLAVSARGLTRSGLVHDVVGSGVAARMRARFLRAPLEPTRIVPVLDSEHGFTVQVRPDRLRAADLTAAGGRGVRGRLRVLSAVDAPLAELRLAGPGAVVTTRLRPDADGWFAFAAELPDAGANAAWTVRAVDERGVRYRVSWPDEATAGLRVEAADGSVAWRRSSRGFVDLVTDSCALEAERVEVGPDRLAVVVRSVGLRPADLAAARLSSHHATLPATEVAGAGEGRTRLVFPLHTTRWGGPDLPLPSAGWAVELPHLELTCGVDNTLIESFPLRGLTAHHGWTVDRVPRTNRLRVSLRAPLAEDERGRRAQRRLADAYTVTDHAPLDAVLFTCYRGEWATDSQRALHEELHRRGSPLRLLWAVSDHSVPLPEGGEPVLIGSRAWFEAIGRCRYLCQNVDVERWYRKQPHQRYLQTFHGYPFKSMGASLWRAQGKGEWVIAAEKERRSAAWDAILVPEEFCVDLYRREYGYDGEVLVTGYPRDDALVSADRAAVRSAVLERLGLPEGKKLVLYAPTWRDTSALSPWTAELFTALDLDELAERLGEDHVLLLRGHNYNLRAGRVPGWSRVLDVSAYPEVNDLILAADVAVLDYSSLRFDWLLTGKPALFFVPDLEDYLSSRTALFEYAPTAPGPLLRTTGEVADALLDLDAVSAEHAAARAVFCRRFHRLHDGHATERVVDAFFR